MGYQRPLYYSLLVLTIIALLGQTNAATLAMKEIRGESEGITGDTQSANTSVSERNRNALVGSATNIIAASILKENADSNQNFVFSPLGFASILAMLGEGARGETVVDITNTLRYPLDQTLIRASYKRQLSLLQGDNPLTAPQFKTWLYIYRNNSVNEEFRRTLHEDYFVDVKEIDRLEMDEFSDEASSSGSSTSLNQPQADSPIVDPENSKDVPEFMTLNLVQEDETRLIDGQSDASKFDEVIEDKQYVEVPVIREEIAQQLKEKEQKEKEHKMKKLKEQTNINNVDKTQNEKELVKPKETVELKESARLRVPVKGFDNFEIMEAQESHFDAREFGARGEGDVTSVISGNSLVGKSNKPGSTETSETKMILFNGLYYRGNWATPFQELRSDVEHEFYKSATEKQNIKLMRARGTYQYAELAELGVQAIELPYENNRYALLVVLPVKQDGLSSLLTEFNPTTLTSIVSELSEVIVDISFPKFNFDAVSGAEKSLSKSGLAKIFTNSADFSGISIEQRLHIDELKQQVSFRVDEGSSSENFLTATNLSERSASNIAADHTFVADHPFLFVVRDVIDNVIIVAGKLIDPPADDEPTVLLQE